MNKRKFRTSQLDSELGRRDRYPAASLRLPGFTPQAVTVADLQTELDATPPDHPDRTWREWELALAQRQMDRFPGRVFARVIYRKDDKNVKVA